MIIHIKYVYKHHGVQQQKCCYFDLMAGFTENDIGDGQSPTSSVVGRREWWAQTLVSVACTLSGVLLVVKCLIRLIVGTGEDGDSYTWFW